jgi:Holliday junction resolvase RusA-like endonuclease
MPDGETLFPFEVVLQGTPVSRQSTNQARRQAWKEQVTAAARQRQLETYQLGLLDDRALAATIYYFPSAPMEGDVDNIVKLIVDALKGIAYLDDRVLERVIVQKFEPDAGWEFQVRTDQLALALDTEPPVCTSVLMTI